MTRPGLKAAVAAIAAAALVATGCGEDSSDDSSGGDFATEVGEICEDTQQQFATANENLVLRDATYSKKYREVNQPIYDDYLKQLEAVEVPADKQEAYDAYVTAIRAQSELILDDPLGPIEAGLGEKETEFTRKVDELNADAVAAGEEAGIPAVCTTGSAEPAPAE